MTVSVTRMRQTISRAEAAAMLRSARKKLALCDERAGETIGWTLTVLRDNYRARLIKIDYLLRTGHWDSADALIARTIMHLRDRPLLRLRLARSLVEQGRIEQAAAEMRGVLRARPEHAGVLTLAAHIAAARGAHREAAALLLRASNARPYDSAVRVALVQALLRAGLNHHATLEFERISHPPALLTARILRAQNRWLEAIECLQRAIGSTWNDATLACELIDLFERSGDAVRFRNLLPDLFQAPPEVQLRGAEACLRFGDGVSAIKLAERVATVPVWRNKAERITSIARVLHEGNENAAAHLDLDQRDTARLWLAAMLGRLTVSQIDGRVAGADPFASILQPLMRHALHAIEQAVDEDQLAADDQALAVQHREALKAALSGSLMRLYSCHLVPTASSGSESEQPGDANELRRAA